MVLKTSGVSMGYRNARQTIRSVVVHVDQRNVVGINGGVLGIAALCLSQNHVVWNVSVNLPAILYACDNHKLFRAPIVCRERERGS